MYKYKEAGVDIAKADRLTKSISSLVDNIGGFAGLYDLCDENYLVASTDGVGTKILLAQEYNKLEGIGVDCVAMCVNDIICTGAKPLFFLDYFSSGVIDESDFFEVVRSIKKGCSDYDIPLIGGETAELPALVSSKTFDVAGFCVGIVKKKDLIAKRKSIYSQLQGQLQQMQEAMKDKDGTIETLERQLVQAGIKGKVMQAEMEINKQKEETKEISKNVLKGLKNIEFTNDINQLSKADVFIRNTSPGSMANIGLGASQLLNEFKKLIVVDLVGYGQDTAYSDMKAYDLLVQAESGLCSITGGPDEPSKVGISIADMGTGMNAYSAILEALLVDFYVS